MATGGSEGAHRPKATGLDDVIYNFLVQSEAGYSVPIPVDYALYQYRKNMGLKWHELTGDTWQHTWRTFQDLHYGSVEAEYEAARPKE